MLYELEDVCSGVGFKKDLFKTKIMIDHVMSETINIVNNEVG